MRQELWERRANDLRQYSGLGLGVYEVSEQSGLTKQTVARYAEKYGFDFTPLLDPARAKPAGMVKRVEDLKTAAAQGKTRQQASEELGVTITTVSRLARDYNIAFTHALSHGADARSEAMAAMYRGGKTLAEIGDLYKLTRERVRQIIRKHHGITSMDGGQHVTSARKEAAKQANKERHCFKKHSCSIAEYEKISAIGADMLKNGFLHGRTPIGAFNRQRRNAHLRGIGWGLLLWDWWCIWQASGKWENRGRKKDNYVMCRFGDVGEYAFGNVYIASCSHNTSVQPNNPYRKHHPRHEEVMAEMREKQRDRRVAA